jgi:hypothetical protein
MITTDLQNLLRAYIDEPDQTMVDGTALNLFLDQGYRDFVRYVSSLNPEAITASVTLAFTGNRTYNLSTGAFTVFGLAPNRTRLMMAVKLIQKNTDDDPIRVWDPVSTQEALQSTPFSYGIFDQVLELSQGFTGDLTLHYVPDADVNWDGGGFVDDLYAFHDMIALFAFKQYAIRDGAEFAVVERHLMQRKRDLQRYMRERVSGQTQWVRRRNVFR